MPGQTRTQPSSARTAIQPAIAAHTPRSASIAGLPIAAKRRIARSRDPDRCSAAICSRISAFATAASWAVADAASASRASRARRT